MDDARNQRKRDLLAGDVEVDPDLLDQGDEVAEEVVTEFKRARSRIRLFDSERNLSHSSRFTQHEQREAAQRAQDLMLEGDISRQQATSVVAADLGVQPETVANWGKRWGIDLGGGRWTRRGMTWDLRKREDLFNRQLDAVSMLTDRAFVWISGSGKPPPDWNAANEL